MHVLGINAYHGDSSACLLDDGRLLAAAEEERFRRVKHWAGFPDQAISYCLREAGISLDDVDHIAINRNPRSNLRQRFVHVVATRPARSLVADRLRNARAWLRLSDQFRARFPGQPMRARLHFVEHHRAHLASAYLVSGFKDAIVLSIDGSGDFATAAWGIGQGPHLRIDGRVFFPHSLGVFYEALTQFLGFPNYGDEYKVMGLAAYGKPAYLDQMRRIVRLRRDGTFRLDLGYFTHHKSDFSYTWRDTAPSIGRLWTQPLEDLLGPARSSDEPITNRHQDIASSAQRMYEEALFHLLNSLIDRYGARDLALAGGCALNSVGNGLIQMRSPIRSLYLPPAAGDGGGAIGAAYDVWTRLTGKQPERMWSAYWGPSYDDADLTNALHGRIGEFESQGCHIRRITDDTSLVECVARAIADGSVVGWFQGRMEWGPRALGNRSILCDPRRADMKDLLNAKIKRRESFRPFAPSVLREHVVEWFEFETDVPFMMQVFPIRPEKRGLVPAVTHVDGTGRLQTVHKETNPRYHALISAFRELTGVPIVLNTSFNENEPIVCKPEEAVDCFLRSQMDVLVLGNVLISRANTGHGVALDTPAASVGDHQG